MDGMAAYRGAMAVQMHPLSLLFKQQYNKKADSVGLKTTYAVGSGGS